MVRGGGDFDDVAHPKPVIQTANDAQAETVLALLGIRDCDDVRIFGYGGNAAAHEGSALFVVERTPNFLLANLVDSPRMPQGIPDTFFAGDGVDPRRWHMVLERSKDNQSLLTPALDRPVLYKRGRDQNQTKTRQATDSAVRAHLGKPIRRPWWFPGHDDRTRANIPRQTGGLRRPQPMGTLEHR